MIAPLRYSARIFFWYFDIPTIPLKNRPSFIRLKILWTRRLFIIWTSPTQKSSRGWTSGTTGRPRVYGISTHDRNFPIATNRRFMDARGNGREPLYARPPTPPTSILPDGACVILPNQPSLFQFSICQTEQIRVILFVAPLVNPKKKKGAEG